MRSTIQLYTNEVRDLGALIDFLDGFEGFISIDEPFVSALVKAWGTSFNRQRDVEDLRLLLCESYTIDQRSNADFPYVFNVLWKTYTKLEKLRTRFEKRSLNFLR